MFNFFKSLPYKHMISQYQNYDCEPPTFHKSFLLRFCRHYVKIKCNTAIPEFQELLQNKYKMVIYNNINVLIL